MKPRFIRPFAPFLVAALFGGALWLLHHELARYRYRDILRAFAGLPLPDLITATGFAGLGYLALTAYDTLALRFLGRQLKYAQTALASFLAYALAHTLGFSFVTSSAVRYRLYSNWGLSTVEIAGITAFAGVTYWLGALTMGGAALLFGPGAYLHLVPIPVVLLRVIGGTALLVVAGYLVASVLHRQTITLAGRQIALPGPGMAFAQLAASLGDWLAAAATLYAILPPEVAPPFPVFAGIFLVAQLAGVVSHVPGGLGVFETVMLLLVGPGATPAVVLAAILAYRAIYYLLPFAIAVLTLGGIEVERHRRRLGQAARTPQVWTAAIAPRVLSVSTFLAGVVLLLSGATPAAHARLAILAGLLPLAVIEVSHFAGSLVGFGLIVLAWGLRRRLRAAYRLTIVLLVTGIAAAVLRGLDLVEAGVLAALLVALVPAGRHFPRRALLGSEPLTTEWVLAIGTALLASLWLGAFAYQHVDYTTELWWRFALRGDAPRFLRAEFGVLVAALGLVLVRLLRPAPPEPRVPTPDELDLAQGIIARAPRAAAHQALLGDRYLLFNEGGTAFLMFVISKRSWVALGDPVGPPEEHEDLAWRFREMADQHGGRTAFYEARPEGLPLYLDLGLTPIKLGEEARVPLGTWSLEGPAGEGLRRIRQALTTLGYRFEVVPATMVPALSGELRGVSDPALNDFEERYLARLPLAVIRRGAALIAFAPLWLGGQHEEAAADRLRQRADAPAGLTDFFLCALADWARGEGYRWLNLGTDSRTEPAQLPAERSPVYLAVQGRLAAANVLADVLASTAGARSSAPER